jgi:hypothetical protein
VRTVAIEASLTRSNARYLTPSSAGQGVGRASTRDTKKLVPRVASTSALNIRVQPTPQNVSDTSLQRAQNGGVPSTFGYVRETVDRALGNHDIVLLAAPPLLSSADTIAMIQMPAGAIIVARAGRDDVIEVAAAVRELERCAPPVVGAIICGNGHRNGDGEYPFDLELDGTDSSGTSFFYGMAAK